MQCFFKNARETERKRRECSSGLIHNGKNLLAFRGSRDDYAGFGRFLARSMLTREEREKTCWFAQRATQEGRLPASEDEQKVFRGIISDFSRL